jgi:type I restriction enzyme M protein
LAARPDGKGATIRMSQQQSKSNFVCTVAGLRRGRCRPRRRGAILFPFTILRRLDAVLESTKLAVLAEAAERGESPAALVFIAKTSGHNSHNTCAFTRRSPRGNSLGDGNDPPYLRRKKPCNG